MPDDDTSSPSGDPMLGNKATDLVNLAMNPDLTAAPDPRNWQPPTPEALQAMLPGYEVQQFIARGGMGAVYRGVQTSLGRSVAIKILPPALREDEPHFAERFKQEARSMAQLNHPGIVSVYDFGEMPGGTLYFIMEFIDGPDVGQMVAQQGRLSSAHAMAITAHVCDALQYAHEHGVVHRDIKPANIMVGYDGRVKVADFGLAKNAQQMDMSLTQSGHVMGTPHFVAPEALMLGLSVDHRADIYAVGVMLYQMLTGKLPQGLFEMPSLKVPGLDPRYDAIVAGAMREDREQRYQRIADMRRALDAILTQPVVKSEVAKQTVPPAVVVAKSVQPQRPAGQPYRPPQRRSSPPPKKKSSAGRMIAVVIITALAGGYFWMHRVAPASSVLAVATKESPFTNSLGMKFVPVPGTNVLFCIHETRYKDYAAYAADAQGADGSWKAQSADDFTPTENKEDHPVMTVSWEDAQKFCAWLGKKEGKHYRLPTDQEWSIAVGIGREEKWTKDTTPATVFKDQDEFPWGNNWPPPKGSGNYSDESRHAKAPGPNAQYLERYDDGYPTTAPVMSFKPNRPGLYDMSGNVWEWCEDWYDNAKTDRVLRGGSWWECGRGDLLSSLRNHHAPGDRYVNHGFRCVLEAKPSEPAIAANLSTTPKETATARKDNPIINSLGMKFVPVPGTGVLFCVHETRYKDYAAYAAEAQDVDGTWKDQSANGFTPVESTEDHPVTKVGWDDAQKFCAWLSRKEAKTYRLPTDQEWSVAVGLDENWEKGTTSATILKNQTDFPWGDEWPPPKGSGNFSDQSRKAKAPTSIAQYLDGYDDGFPTTAPVMSFKANKLGLHDLSGNVWEWCEDWYDDGQKKRVLRGGSWLNYERDFLLSSDRARDTPTSRYFNGGFRCVLVEEKGR